MTTAIATTPPADVVQAGERRACSMCAAVAGAATFPIFLDEEFVAFLDREPSSAGHTVVATREHIHYIDEVPADAAHRLLTLLDHLARAIGEATATGDDVGIFLTDGEADFRAAPHVHVHVFPRPRPDAVAAPTVHLAQRIRALLGEVDLSAPVLPANPGRRSVFWHDMPAVMSA